jgi:thymidylate synthase ThyX
VTISAKIIADSISPDNIRLTTMQLRYPRFIHAEFMTHRMFSRNASSSRAIPVERLIKDVMDDTAMPIHWGKNQKGMQADKECDERVMSWHFDAPYGASWTNKEAWLFARDNAIKVAKAFDEAGYHKQIVNRLLEPFSHINVLVTATDYANFFALRDHKDAQPEIRELAQQMRAAMWNSTVKTLKAGEWHLPYVNDEDWISASDLVQPGTPDGDQVYRQKLDLMTRVSVARCARVSYLTQEGKKPTIEEDIALFQRLIGSHPLHASPAEHQATPDDNMGLNCIDWLHPELHGNFNGWIQYRKTLPGEYMEG